MVAVQRNWVYLCIKPIALCLAHNTCWYILGPQLSWYCSIFWGSIVLFFFPQETWSLSILPCLQALSLSIPYFSFKYISPWTYILVYFLSSHPPPWDSYYGSYKWGNRAPFSLSTTRAWALWEKGSVCFVPWCLPRFYNGA